MIILCITLLIVGFLLKLAIVWTVGIVVLAVGLILVLLGALGWEVGAAGITSGPRRACWRTVCQHALPQLATE